MSEARMTFEQLRDDYTSFLSLLLWCDKGSPDTRITKRLVQEKYERIVTARSPDQPSGGTLPPLVDEDGPTTPAETILAALQDAAAMAGAQADSHRRAYSSDRWHALTLATEQAQRLVARIDDDFLAKVRAAMEDITPQMLAMLGTGDGRKYSLVDRVGPPELRTAYETLAHIRALLVAEDTCEGAGLNRDLRKAVADMPTQCGARNHGDVCDRIKGHGGDHCASPSQLETRIW